MGKGEEGGGTQCDNGEGMGDELADNMSCCLSLLFIRPVLWVLHVFEGPLLFVLLLVVLVVELLFKSCCW